MNGNCAVCWSPMTPTPAEAGVPAPGRHAHSSEDQHKAGGPQQQPTQGSQQAPAQVPAGQGAAGPAAQQTAPVGAAPVVRQGADQQAPAGRAQPAEQRRRQRQEALHQVAQGLRLHRARHPQDLHLLGLADAEALLVPPGRPLQGEGMHAEDVGQGLAAAEVEGVEEDNADEGPARTLQCGHAFHEACIRKWLEQCHA